MMEVAGVINFGVLKFFPYTCSILGGYSTLLVDIKIVHLYICCVVHGASIAQRKTAP